MVRIVRADWLIRFQPMSGWRSSLGMVETAQSDIVKPQPAIGPEPMQRALHLAGAVERAAKRLPYSPKCLPQAMALQWALEKEGIAGRLVIATQNTRIHGGEEKLQTDQHHAWVEAGGRMLIGKCDRDTYRLVLGFSSGSKPGKVTG